MFGGLVLTTLLAWRRSGGLELMRVRERGYWSASRGFYAKVERAGMTLGARWAPSRGSSRPVCAA
jgi:hypothetical protein